MKDAKGHGSDSRGMASAVTAGNHQRGVLRIGRGPIKVQELNTRRVGLGNSPWQTVGRYKNDTVAERQAQNARIDKADTPVRISSSARSQSLARVRNLGRTGSY